MRPARSLGAALAALALFCLAARPCLAFGVALASSQAQVWVAGQRIAFDHLGIAYGDPVAPVDDPGLNAMLAAVGARASWQPGTRFVAITAADGSLITFTLGSNAVSVDGVPSSMPFAPFTSGTDVYVPLLPLAKALHLGVRGYRGGYVFVPQVVSVDVIAGKSRATLRISGSAPLAWRSSYAANASARTLSLSFPGFGTDLAGATPIKNADASSYAVSESGPPGYPTTTITVSLSRSAHFAAHRIAPGNGVELIVAPDAAALRVRTASATPAAVRVSVSTLPPSTPRPTPEPTEAPPPSPAASVEMGPAPTPASEPTDVATAEPLGPEAPASAAPEASTSPAPAAAAQEQKITDVSVSEVATGTRIVMTLTGPVTFEWHRLADPDDRYWLDIHNAQLVGPAQVLPSRLNFIKEIKVSQHALVPEKIVRVSITPTQAIGVTVGAIQGSPNALGIEIETQAPAADAATSGIGAVGTAVAVETQNVRPSVATDQDLIVIDPGHGGSDPGSLNPDYGLTEKTLTLAISTRLADDLRKQGWKVTMTRVGDYDVGDPSGPDAAELQARCDVANAAGARMFVSVHINASTSSAPNGTTTYYWHPGDHDFAQDVQNEVVSATGITDDGVRRETFYVIHHTVMPSILVEVAYLSNAHDAELLTRPAFLDKVADAIARGIGDYSGGPPTPVGQTGTSH